ncbi:HlyC/CorC family transporter [Spirochaetota bacterium]|nr:HlyC/CorC family transporter [Spirochaetota bacterium]
MISVVLFLTFVLMMMFSFYFSGSEAGILGLSKEKLYSDLERKKRGAALLRPFVLNIPLFFSVVLLGNTLSNVLATFVANRLWESLFGTQALTLFLIFSTGLFLLVGEILPKILFRRYTPAILYITSPILVFFRNLFSPFVVTMMALERLLFKDITLVRSNAEQKQDKAGAPPFPQSDLSKRTSASEVDFSLTDFQEIVTDSADEGVFSAKDIAVIKNLSSFSRIKAEEVMEPLVNLFMLQEHQDLNAVMNIIEKQKSRYIPVYESRIDNLTGFIDMVAVFRSRKRKKCVKTFIKQAIYVPETATVESLYRKFSIFRDKLLIVVNEYGGSSGVITLDTIANKALDLERRYHEKEREQQSIKQISEHLYQMDASLDIDKFNETFKVHIVKKGFETLAGLLLYLYEEVPEPGIVLYYENIRFKIMETTQVTITKVNVHFLSAQAKKRSKQSAQQSAVSEI